MKNGLMVRSELRAGGKPSGGSGTTSSIGTGPWCYQYAKRRTDPVTTQCGYDTELDAFNAVQALGVAVFRNVALETDL